MLWARIAYSVKSLYRLDGPGIESDPEAHPSSPTMGDGFVSRGKIGLGMALTTHTPLASRLKKE